MNFQTPNNYNLNFCSASDLTLRYMLDKRSHFMPERILSNIKELCALGKDSSITLKELHRDVYEKLKNAKSLDEAKTMYPEFKDILDITEIEKSSSKAIKIIKEKMPLKDFTLQYLKDVFVNLMTKDKLVEKYNFTNRSLVSWLNSKLKIILPPKEYNILVKLTDEAENNKVAEKARQAIYNDPAAQKRRCDAANIQHKTPEYREKMKTILKEFHSKNPEYARKTSLISKRTWDKCPEIKKALSEYTAAQNNLVRSILEKQVKNAKLNDKEKKVLSAYYKGFWNMHPEFVDKYKIARYEAIKELEAEHLITKLGLNNSCS